MVCGLAKIKKTLKFQSLSLGINFLKVNKFQWMSKLLHLTYWFLAMLSVPDLTSIWNLAYAVISTVGTGCRLYEVYGAFLEQHKMWFCLSTKSEFYPSDLYESHSRLRSLFGHYLAWSKSLKKGKNFRQFHQAVLAFRMDLNILVLATVSWSKSRPCSQESTCRGKKSAPN